MNKSRLFRGHEIAVDLGTANTIVYARGAGIVSNQPSVVAIDETDGKVIGVGHEAKSMVGRTPGNIVASSPLEDGVISSTFACERMLRYFIGIACQARWPKPRVVICVPSVITDVEKSTVIEAARVAGAGKVYTIEEPMAAAIGENLEVLSPKGSMVVDIGGGTTEIAVISLGGIVKSTSLRTGGKRMDTALMTLLKDQHNLQISERTAEVLKIEMGSAWHREEEKQGRVAGSDATTGLPKSVIVNSCQIREGLKEEIYTIVDSIKQVLDETPPDLAADVAEFGIRVTGGGALLMGVDKVISHETGVRTTLAVDPLYSVVLGSGRSLEDYDLLQRVTTPQRTG